MENNKKSTFIVLLIVATLLAALLFNTWQAFELTSDLTRSSGRYHLESISGELSETIGAARQMAMTLAIQAQPLVWDKVALEEFIYSQKAEVVAQNHSCFNVYMAGSDWAIIPDFDMPDDYVASQRDWYTGAKRAKGNAFVTQPYVDAMTGNICYSVSVMLGDRDTVLALDYDMNSIQHHIMHMHENGSQNALIVTGEGVIAGCSDESLLGQKLSEALPDYSSIFALVKSRKDFVNTRIKSGIFYENLFAMSSGAGWYLIVSENDWNLFKNAYIQLIGSALIALLLSVIVIVFYMLSHRRQRAAQRQLAEKDQTLAQMAGQLIDPLNAIINMDVSQTDTPDGRLADKLVMLSTAGRQIMEALQEASDRSRAAAQQKKKSRSSDQELRMDKRFRTRILLVMVLVVLISITSNAWISMRWSREKLRGDLSAYDYTVSEWISRQKSILDMFCSLISTNPQLLDDYDRAVETLNRITLQYPEISVTYMTNPAMSPTVVMNNGWTPPADWRVEERQWYIDTLESRDGWTISAPYYDSQTGLYCVTFAERVYDSETGAFLGNFGIDFFMDKLTDILGGSYTESSYAFLADVNGVMLNHPNASYQMSESTSINVSEVPYGEVKTDGASFVTIRDYDGTLRIVTAKRNAESGFVVYEAMSFWRLFGPTLLSEALILLVLLLCAMMVFRQLTSLIHWQANMNTRMKAAADTAIAAGKAKSRFLAQMSHEIRTPINTVLGMNEMILREAGDETIIDYASGIQTAGRTLLSLINSILDFSKIEEGKMEIVPVEYDTTSVINNLVASISERARAKDLELIVEVDPSLPSRLIGDDVRVAQVIMNLLTNAVKYTEKGSVRFSIQGGERREDQITLHVAVEDTGIGIRQEDIPKLFESFERLDEVRNHNIEGTGLGMSIVTRLLAMMNSRLEVKSVYGQGSLFAFDVQQKISDATPIGDYSRRLADSRASVGGETLMTHDADVLVVDDNDMNLKVAKNLMKLFGIVPDLAVSGQEAMERVRRKHYHIVFLDHMMPGMDGIETLNRLRAEKLLPDDTVVIVLTANAVNGAKEQYLACGFDDYLSKPIDVARLEHQLMRYLPKALCTTKAAGDAAATPEKAQPAAGDTHDKDPIEALKAVGYDTQAGLRFAAGDRAFYLELVESFARDEGGHSETIRRDYQERDYGDYQIRVHALKSTARQIGANELSDMALAQETAAKTGDTAAIEAGAEPLLERYARTARELLEALGMTETEPGAPAMPGDEPQGADAADAATPVSAEALRATLTEAAACIDNFESERAVELLRPLEAQRCGDLALGAPVRGIISALEDFDTFGAGEQLNTLMEQVGSRSDE